MLNQFGGRIYFLEICIELIKTKLNYNFLNQQVFNVLNEIE